MAIIATLHPDGQTIVMARTTRVLALGAQGIYVIVTFPELRTVTQVLHVELDTSPPAWISGLTLQDKTYLGNTVGMSLYLNPLVGTTVGIEVVAIGF